MLFFGKALLLVAIVWGAPNIYQMLSNSFPALSSVAAVQWKFLEWKPSLPWSLAISFLFYYSMTALLSAGRFLYFQF